MHTLEQIAENPRAATIAENLVLVADPLGDYRSKHGELSQEQFEEIVEALKEHFVYGEGLIARFRSDLVGLDPQARFEEVKVENAYDMLRILLNRKPKPLDDKLAWLWKKRDAVTHGRVQLPEEDRLLFELIHYTHQWHHFVTKKIARDNPFLPLQKVSEDGISMYIRDSPNKGYPAYALYGWIERAKTRERLVDKLLQKIFNAIANAPDGKNFYSQYFGEDQFGVRAISFARAVRIRVEGIFYPPEGVPRRWIVDDYEDLEKSQRKRFRGLQYMVRWTKDPEVPVPLQAQLQLFPHLLLDDFFKVNSHPRYRVRRDDVLDEFRRRDPKLYDRMRDNVNQALSFLPK